MIVDIDTLDRANAAPAADAEDAAILALAGLLAFAVLLGAAVDRLVPSPIGIPASAMLYAGVALQRIVVGAIDRSGR